MVRLNVAVSTKISEEDYELLKQVAREKFESGVIREPNISRLLRALIKGIIRKKRAEDPTSIDDACGYPPGSR